MKRFQKPHMRKLGARFRIPASFNGTADYVRQFGELNHHKPAYWQLGGAIVLL